MATPLPPSTKTTENASHKAREQLFEKVRQDKHLPSLGVAISKVIEITSSHDDSIADLTRYILADVGLTQQILQLSNTIAYRSVGGTAVTTISRAIFLLGFDTIKANAIAAMLIDGFKNQSHAEIVKHELMLALCASVAAREINKSANLTQPEEASVAALFRNIGRVLVAYFEPHIFQTIVQLEARDADASNQYCVTIFGCSFDRLGEHVLREWHIPESIIRACQRNSHAAQVQRSQKVETLANIASLSEAVAQFIVTHGSANGSDLTLRDLTQRTQDLFGLNQSDLTEIIERVETEACQLASSLKVSEKNTARSSVPAHTVAQKESAFFTEFALKSDNTHHAKTAACYASGKPKNARELLLAGVQDLSQLLSSPKLKLNDVLLLTLETLQLAMGFRFTAVCLLDSQRARFSARLAVGSDFARHQEYFQFEADGDSDVFKLALRENTDIFIESIDNQRLQALLPAWFKLHFSEVESFIVLPIVLETRAIGLIYADRCQAAPEGITSDETALIKTLKAQLISSMNRRSV